MSLSGLWYSVSIVVATIPTSLPAEVALMSASCSGVSGISLPTTLPVVRIAPAGGNVGAGTGVTASVG